MLLSSALSDMVKNSIESLYGPIKTLTILPEIQFGIDTCLLFVPAIFRIPTPGQRILGLQYQYSSRDTLNTNISIKVSRKRTISISIMLISTYIFNKIKSIIRQYGWDELPLSDTRYHYTIIIHMMNTVVSFIKVWMALRFIIYGDYVTFTERISQLSLEYRPISSNNTSSTLPIFRRPQLFDTLALQILSNAASELVQSISNLTDWNYTYQYIIRLLRRNYRRIKHTITLSLPTSVLSSLSINNSTDIIPLNILSPRSPSAAIVTTGITNSLHNMNTILFPSIYKVKCVYCSTTEALIPIQALPCKHTYCYFCLHSSLLQDSSFECPACGEYIQNSKLLQ